MLFFRYSSWRTCCNRAHDKWLDSDSHPLNLLDRFLEARRSKCASLEVPSAVSPECCSHTQPRGKGLKVLHYKKSQVKERSINRFSTNVPVTVDLQKSRLQLPDGRSTVRPCVKKWARSYHCWRSRAPSDEGRALQWRGLFLEVLQCSSGWELAQMSIVSTQRIFKICFTWCFF